MLFRSVSMMYSLRPLNYLHGKTLVQDFGPSALKAVRELLIHGYMHPKHGAQGKICRVETNKRIKRVRRMMKWAVENEIVPPNVLLALQAVAPPTTAPTRVGVLPDNAGQTSR